MSLSSSSRFGRSFEIRSYILWKGTSKSAVPDSGLALACCLVCVVHYRFSGVMACAGRQRRIGRGSGVLPKMTLYHRQTRISSSPVSASKPQHGICGEYRLCILTECEGRGQRAQVLPLTMAAFFGRRHSFVFRLAERAVRYVALLIMCISRRFYGKAYFNNNSRDKTTFDYNLDGNLGGAVVVSGGTMT